MTTAQRHAWRPRQQHNKGFMLIALIVILAMGGLYFLVSNLTPEAIEARRQAKTDEALMQAREALIGYALQYRSNPATSDADAMYGHLPTPDLGDHTFSPSCVSEGCATKNSSVVTGNTVLVGRFPWKTVGTGPLRDGYGECLWYAVSATHRDVNSTTATMNWDTLAAPDVLYGSGPAGLAAVNAHQRPIAVIFSPGAAFDGGRTASSDAPECGGNYDATHYVDTTLNYAQRALSVTSDMIFSALRKSSVRSTNPLKPDSVNRVPSYVDEINDMIDQMTTCARDQIAANAISANAKVAAPCTTALNSYGPTGYYGNYSDQVFVAKCASCSVTVTHPPTGYVQPPSCAGALLFGNQRNSTQDRSDSTKQSLAINYLEGANLDSFNSPDSTYTGDYALMTTATQSLGQDIVRCIPAGTSLNQVASSVLASLGLSQLTNYDAATRTLTLGAVGVSTTQVGTANAKALFGCSWTPESHSMGSGLRSYFKFNIANTGEGFTFAIIDGDRNGINVCGAAQQHLGYSGNNTTTPFIAYPKIGIEVDTTETTAQKKAFNPTLSNTLTNGRSDPNYTGGHVAIVYWGGENPYPTGDIITSCIAPKYWSSDVWPGACYLPQEEDDNVHGLPPPDASPRPSPRNPAAPATPATPPAGVYKLDPSLSQIPTNIDVHVRVEISKRAPTSLTSVRVAPQTNIILSSPGAALDGITMANDDRVLLTAQDAPADNGIYSWNGAASAMTRTTDANTATTLLGATTQVAAGTYAGTTWRQTATITTLGTDAVNWVRYVVNNYTVRVATRTNIMLSGPGATLDGITMTNGDRVLVTAQSTPADNGVYSWNGATSAMTRTTDANTATAMLEATANATEGTNAGTTWRQTATVNTLGTDKITWSQYVNHYLIEAWILAESGTVANQIAAMKNTSQPMSQLYPGFTPHLRDLPLIYDIQGGTCPCSTSQVCGSDNVCYTKTFQNVRLGFTNSQSTAAKDQLINITNFTTTWLP
jgi:hypothetical protein